MRRLKVPGAIASLSSLLACVAGAGCATGGGSPISFAADGGPDTGLTRYDGTVQYYDTGFPGHDAGFDATVGLDQYVPPTPDGPLPGQDSSVPPGKDASYDGGLVFFGNPGTPCAALGMVQAQSCGICGQQTSKCIVRPDGGVPFDAGHDAGTPPVPDSGSHADAATDATTTPDAAGGSDASQAGDAGHVGAHDGSIDAHHQDSEAPHDAAKAVDAAKKDAASDLVWSEWGSCTAQIDGGCMPGTSKTQSCGMCGTQTIICEPDCEYGATNCLGQVIGGCIPGTTDFTVDPSCDDAGVDGGGGPGSGREKVCTSSCTWDASSTCVTPPPA